MKTLIQETKEAMGYNPSPACCKDCATVEETQAEYICNYSKLCSFITTKHASCERFVRRKEYFIK